MKRVLSSILIIIAMLAIPGVAAAQSGSYQRSAHRRSEIRCSFCERTASGRIRRSSSARREFQREFPCPSTGEPAGSCPGYVVDHAIPLKHGGPDLPSNMQWQTLEEAREKDRAE